MTLKLLRIFLILTILVASASIAHTYSLDPPLRRTGAPNEGTCNDVDCHNDNNLNDVGGSLTVSIMDGSTEVNSYEPGKDYTVKVNVQKAGASIYGFMLTALNNEGGSVGTMSGGTSEVDYGTSGVSGKVRHYAFHNLAQPDGNFQFMWKAPATAVPVTFYASGNAANNSGDNTGDYIFTATKSLSSTSAIAHGSNSLEARFNIYPQPAANTAELRFTLPQSTSLSLRMFDLKGNEIHNIPAHQFGAGSHTLQLPVSQLSEGVYLVHLQVGGEHIYRKVMKQ